MIISASRRTDIPAFFSDWFYNRIERGFVLVRNPMNTHQVSRISIRPEIVDCIVFWTKNPEYFIKRLHQIEMYRYYFQYTITSYGKILEPNIPSLEELIECFKRLSKTIGRKRVIWRYDPIIITDEHSINYHKEHFAMIAQQLSEHTNKCVISFVDFYKKTMKNMSKINYYTLLEDQIIDLTNSLKLISEKYNIVLTSCAEEIDLSKQGIMHGKCIDDKLIEEISGYSLEAEKDKNQRAECGCIASIDIGAYNTCPHGCLYCYANYDMNQVRSNYAQHKKDSDLLYGNITKEDKITDKKVLSCKIVQKTLFDRDLPSQFMTSKVEK